MNTLCRLFGYSRQSFYNREDPDNDFVDNALETMIVEKAREYRKDNPGLGCAKLYLIVKRLFESTDRMPGRDAFIELLRANGLMVQLKRRRHYKTTDSSHHYHKYDNFLTSSSCHPKIFVKEFSYFLMSCHQHCLGVNLLVQR